VPHCLVLRLLLHPHLLNKRFIQYKSNAKESHFVRRSSDDSWPRRDKVRCGTSGHRFMRVFWRFRAFPSGGGPVGIFVRYRLSVMDDCEDLVASVYSTSRSDAASAS